MNLWLIFISGLTIGGLGCLAVQGGLLASVSADRHPLKSALAFIVVKLIVYTILGALLGGFGRVINFSDSVQAFLQLFAGIYMLLIAADLLNLHPFFRRFIITPPRFLARLVRDESKSKDFFAPAFLGGMTIFIPCGTTLAMEALALSSASPFLGAAIMAVFTLGTIPLFVGLGFVANKINPRFAAALVLIMAAYSIGGSLVALGVYKPGVKSTQAVETTQNVEIRVTSSGYSPNYIRVKVGEPVNIKLIGVSNFSCASAFRIPAYQIAKNLGPNETSLISFIPKQPGKIQFNCSMGMYSGIIEAI